METTQNSSEQRSSERPYRNLREYTDQLHLWLYQYRMWNSMQSFSTMFPLMLNHCTGPQLSFPHNNNNNTVTNNATIAPDSTTASNNTRRTTQFQNQRGKGVLCADMCSCSKKNISTLFILILIHAILYTLNTNQPNKSQCILCDIRTCMKTCNIKMIKRIFKSL